MQDQDALIQSNEITVSEKKRVLLAADFSTLRLTLCFQTISLTKFFVTWHCAMSNGTTLQRWCLNSTTLELVPLVSLSNQLSVISLETVWPLKNKVACFYHEMVTANNIKTSFSISLLNQCWASTQAEHVPMAISFSTLFQAGSLEGWGMQASVTCYPRHLVALNFCCCKKSALNISIFHLSQRQYFHSQAFILSGMIWSDLSAFLLRALVKQYQLFLWWMMLY